MSESDFPTPNQGWCDEARQVFVSVTRDYDLAVHERETLRRACEQLDHAVRAAQEVARDGITVLDRWDRPREHPSLGTERLALHCYRLLMRELRLDFNDNPAEKLRLKP